MGLEVQRTLANIIDDAGILQTHRDALIRIIHIKSLTRKAVVNTNEKRTRNNQQFK